MYYPFVRIRLHEAVNLFSHHDVLHIVAQALGISEKEAFDHIVRIDDLCPKTIKTIGGIIARSPLGGLHSYKVFDGKIITDGNVFQSGMSVALS